MIWLSSDDLKEIMNYQAPLKKGHAFLNCKNCKVLFRVEKYKVPYTKYCSVRCYRNKTKV